MAKPRSKLSAADLELANDAKKESTEKVFSDKIYNWLVDRYTKKHREFTFSDQFVWKGAVYVVPEFFGYIVFFAIFLLLASISFKKYGEARTIVYVLLFLLWRLNVMVKYLAKIDKKL
jgi:hypothetical protein